MDFVCISTTGWDEIWGSRQQIMLRLSNAGHRVLFVERQVGPEHLFKHAEYRRMDIPLVNSNQAVQVQENIWRWQPPLMIPGRYYSQALNRLGQHRLAGQIQAILRQLNFQSPVLWLYPPHSADLIGKFQERLSIYHCIERFAGVQVGRKYRVMVAQENRLLRKADQVLVHSLGLKELYEVQTRRPIVFISSGVDVDHFQSESSVHPLVAGIPHPRLVVSGTLDDRIDFELLNSILVARQDWHLVLIGREKSAPAGFNRLKKHKNVHLLGHHPYTDLPALLNGADVALIPYRVNELTRFINPLKAYEYLAVGKAIISVQLPELEPLSRWIRFIPPFTNDRENYTKDFIEAIDHALRDETLEKRELCRDAARAHSWDARMKVVFQTIESLLPGEHPS